MSLLQVRRKQLIAALRDKDSENVIVHYNEKSYEAAVNLTKAYAKWVPAAPNRDKVEVFAPTLLTFRGGYQAQERKDYASNIKNAQWLQKKVNHLCLYVDRLWLPDPLEIIARDIIETEYSFHSLAVHRGLVENVDLALEVVNILADELRVLVEASIVVLYPAIRCYLDGISLGLFQEVRSYSPVELEMAWPEMYVAEGLLYSQQFHSSYAALDAEEFEALNKGSREISKALGVADQRILAALPRMELPAFKALDAKTLVDVRKSVSAFDDFRGFMREMSSFLIAGLEDPAFNREVQALEGQRIEPAAKKLIAELNGTKVLRDRLSDAKVDFLAGAVGGYALKGDIVDALATGTVGALATALFKILTSSDKPRGAAQAIYQLHTGHEHKFWSLE